MAVKIVFSRKGFDSAAGGAPSPVADGRAVSLPIPARDRSATCYADLGLGGLVAAATGGRIAGADPCHADPMFAGGRCAFGQAGAAQAHLANNGVGAGDVFLFFGLFAGPGGADRHHRIFGWLRVGRVIALGPAPGARAQPEGFPLRHPHTIGAWPANNTLYLGAGAVCAGAPAALRLTTPGGPVSRWRIPPWLRAAGLTYHARPARWAAPGLLDTAPRGQEFVSEIGGNRAARDWLDAVLDHMPPN